MSWWLLPLGSPEELFARCVLKASKRIANSDVPMFCFSQSLTLVTLVLVSAAAIFGSAIVPVMTGSVRRALPTPFNGVLAEKCLYLVNTDSITSDVPRCFVFEGICEGCRLSSTRGRHRRRDVRVTQVARNRKAALLHADFGVL